MHCDFSYNHYREMLERAQKEGFVFTNFRNFDKNKNKKKLIILRHDVDYTPKRAVEMAKIEHKLQIKSTFFVRVHGEHYHPLERHNYQYFQEILKLGHEIGLHYEARTYTKKFGQAEINIFRWEKATLEKFFNIKVESASEHRDLGGVTEGYKFFTNQNRIGIKQETYDKRFQDFYLADSCGKWNNGCLCKNLDKNHLQLLTHPDLWGKEALEEVRKKIKKIGLKPAY